MARFSFFFFWGGSLCLIVCPSVANVLLQYLQVGLSIPINPWQVLELKCSRRKQLNFHSYSLTQNSYISQLFSYISFSPVK